MANGQPGFGDSLFKLASQRQAALSAEQARKSNQDNLRRKDINTLSGFDAASIEGDQQRAIFEEAVADVQSYISGTGEYEDAQYDPVNFKKQLMKINSVYNGFKAHGAGDVKTAREALYNDAYTAGGVAREGGELGTNLMSNNNPSSYDESVANHNNYFETARTANGKTMFDENGHPMGYPVVDGEVDRSAAPVSLFKMNAYANPESFRGNTVEVPAATTLDMVQGEKYVATLNRINESLEGVEGKPLREVHDIAVSKLFDDKFSSAGQSEFRETLLIDLVREGKFPSDDKELQQAFINGEFDNEDLIKLIPGVRRDAEKIYADRSFDVAAQSTQAKTRSGTSGLGSEDSPYASIQNRDLGQGDVGNVGGEYQLRVLKDPVVQEGSLFGDYSITAVGINGDGERIATITETTTTVDDITGEETTVKTPRELVISPEAGGLGREIYDSLRLQDPRILGDQHGEWINMNKARKEQLQAAQDEKAAKIKALKAEGKTPEEAQAIVDAGGEEAYDLQQREIALQPQIDNARSMLSGFDGGSFLRKFLEDGMSPEAAKVQVDKARKEAENAGVTGIKGVTEAEKNQLLKDLDNKEMSNDPNAPGVTVAEHTSNIIRMKFNNQDRVPTEGDFDGDGQVGLVEGDDGYVAFGEPGYGYNEMEGEDSFGDPVKGYEAFWAQLGPGDKQFYTEPAEHKRKRLKFEADKAPKSEVGSKPIVESTPERKAELDAELAKQQADRETATRNRLLQEEERMRGEQEVDAPLERSGPSGSKISMTSGQSHMVDALIQSGISEQAATSIASVSQKESGGDHTISEKGYEGTSNKKIREIFSSIRDLSEDELTALKKDNEAFFEKVYGVESSKGSVLGNDEPGDGYKFRGRGLIQLTGKTNYSTASQAIYGDDRLVQNPNLINEDAKTAGQVAAWFITKSGRLKDLDFLTLEEINQDQAKMLADSAYAIVAGGVDIAELNSRKLYPEGIKTQHDWLNL